MLKLLYANVIEGNARWGSEVFLNEALIAARHDTHTIDYRAHRYQLFEQLRSIDHFDAFLLQRGDRFPLAAVRAIQRPRLFYFSELLAVRRDADHLFRSDAFDHYFVRGNQCVEFLVKRQGIPRNRISILLSAFDPKTYYPRPTEKDIDVLFLGSVTPRRAALLSRLQERFDVAVETAFGKDASRLYNRAKIVINLHANNYRDTETRVYEVLGAGGFLISEKLADESPFVSQIHLVEAEGYEQLETQIAYFLANPSARNRIARDGNQYAVENHTFQTRASQLIKQVHALIAEEKYSGPAIDRRLLERLRRQELVARQLRKSKHLVITMLKRWKVRK